MAKSKRARRALTEREQFWRTHLRRIEASGIETKVYGERHGLSVGALYQARKQLVALGVWPERRAAASAPTFAPVRVIDPAVAAAPACRVRLADGTVLEWSAAPATAVLADLLERMSAAR